MKNARALAYVKKINYLCAVKWDARQKLSLQVIISKYYGK